VRIWLKDSERRPDPAPVATDDRKAVLVGLALWLVALAAVVIVANPITTDASPSWFWACITGLALGLIGLGYTHAQRDKN
jgi:hypothetical protein